VGVDAYIVSGEGLDKFLCDHNLNVSARILPEEATKKKIIGYYGSDYAIRCVAFVASNETQQLQFDEYVSYFKDKERVS